MLRIEQFFDEFKHHQYTQLLLVEKIIRETLLLFAIEHDGYPCTHERVLCWNAEKLHWVIGEYHEDENEWVNENYQRLPHNNITHWKHLPFCPEMYTFLDQKFIQDQEPTILNQPDISYITVTESFSEDARRVHPEFIAALDWIINWICTIPTRIVQKLKRQP